MTCHRLSKMLKDSNILNRPCICRKCAMEKGKQKHGRTIAKYVKKDKRTKSIRQSIS